MPPKALRISFYSAWLLLLILQAWFAELGGDEAYYWRYSFSPDWGYFDHPPVTALLIKLGYLLFANELGVRLLFVIMMTATVFLVEKLINPSNLKLFYMIVSSVAIIQIGLAFGGGMFAIPDFPLLFFTAAFFHLYKRYIENPTSWITILLMSVVICLLLLSKYHGILVVGFTVLSNLELLKKKSFWLIVIFSVLLFLPHLLWQVNNDFPSIKYHLYERVAKGYSYSYIAEYLAAQPFVLGPLIGILLIYLGIIFRPEDSFERSLKFVAVGTYLFFLAMSFRGRVEANWTIITLIPLLYIGYNQIEKSEKLRMVVFYSFIISLPLILAVRAGITLNIKPASFKGPYSNATSWVKEIKEKSEGRPVVFFNSYQRASIYQFYSGEEAISLNNVWGRKNQFSTWDSEAALQGKPVMIVSNWPMGGYDTLLVAEQYLPYTFIDNFRSFSNVIISTDVEQPVVMRSSSPYIIKVRLDYRNGSIRDFEANKDYPSLLTYQFFRNGITEHAGSGPQLKNEMIGNRTQYEITITSPAQQGTYDLYLSISTGWLPPTINSGKIKFVVE